MVGIKKQLDRLRRGWRRPEVRQHPIRAISKRISWRWHWQRSPGSPVVLESWWRNLKIALPHTSNASLLFYRTHSDPSLVWLLQTLLYPRMTFLDVGAHIGEFTLIGAHFVGSEGKAIAVEPLPPCAEIIRRNASMNGMDQVKVYEGALCSYTGKIGFQSDPERSSGWIAAQSKPAAFEVPCWTLDDFFQSVGIAKADVVKLDAGGNELAVLRGGAMVLGEGKIGVLIMKLYHPNITRERFGYDSHESLGLLRDWGLGLKLVVREGAFTMLRPEDMDVHFDPLVYSHLLVATKC
jgi:FkbM family methyltransferase